MQTKRIILLGGLLLGAAPDALAQFRFEAAAESGRITYHEDADDGPEKSGIFGGGRVSLLWPSRMGWVGVRTGIISGTAEGKDEVTEETTSFAAVAADLLYRLALEDVGPVIGLDFNTLSGRGVSMNYERRDETTVDAALGVHLGYRFPTWKDGPEVEAFFQGSRAAAKDHSASLLGGGISMSWAVGQKARVAEESAPTSTLTAAAAAPVVIVQETIQLPAETKNGEDIVNPTVARFQVMTFAYASTKMDESSRKKVKVIAEALKSNRHLWESLEVQGYASAGGRRTEMQALDRAKAVQGELLRVGIQEQRTHAAGYGQNRLLWDRAPDVEGQRRVEIEVHGVKDKQAFRRMLPPGVDITWER